MKTKHLLILFLIILSNTITADETCNQKQERTTIDSLKEDIEHIHDHSHKHAIGEDGIDWWSANDEMVKNAKCQEQVPTLKEINLYFDNFPKKRKKAVILGFPVENESQEMITALTDLLYKDDWSGKHKGNYAGKVPATCKKVKCIAESIFGNELGPKLLYLKQRYGFNSSEYVHANSSRLNIDEVDTLIKSSSYLPNFLLPLDKNKQMTVFKRGYAPADSSPDTIANATITFFNPWIEQSSEMKKYTVFHEMSHYVAGEFNLDENSAWLNISGWTKTGDNWKKTKNNIYSSKYGITNPWEDFAEAMSAYRFNPNLLKKASPEKYDFLKEIVFQGIEYTDEESCQEKNSYASKFHDEKEKSKLPLPIKADAAYLNQVTESAYRSCGSKIIGIMAGENDSSFRECVERSIPLRIPPSRTDEKILGPILKSVKHPSLVKASITKTASNNPVNYSAQEIEKFQSENYNNIKISFEKESIGILKKLFKENTYSISHGSAEEYKSFAVCDNTAKYSYQKYEKIDDKTNDKFLAYNNSDKIDNFVKAVCRQIIKNGSGVDKKFTDNEITEAYIQTKSKTDIYFKNLNNRLQNISNQLDQLERNNNMLTRMGANYKNMKESLVNDYNKIIIGFK